MKLNKLFISAYFLTLAAAPRLEAQPVDAQNSADLTKRLGALEDKLKALETEKAAQQPSTFPNVSAGEDGIKITSADKNFALRLGGYLQSDARFFLGDDETKFSNSFLIRRARPILEGTVAKYYDFRFMPDFAGSTTTLHDAYAELKQFPEARLRVGKFKPQIGLERLQSAKDIEYVERALPTNLVPNRDTGISILGDVLENRLSYALGVFNGAVDGASTDNDSSDGKDIVARLWTQPFVKSENALSGLGFGVSASFGEEDGTPSSPNVAQYRSGGQNVFFRYLSDSSAAGGATEDGTVQAAGNRERISPQLTYYVGPFGLLGEYVVSSQKVSLGETKKTLDNDAYQVALSYVLTGEKASFKGVTPEHNFYPSANSWGAFEVAARYNALDIDDDTFPTFADESKSASEADAWGVGINWYWNRNVKLNLDYENTQFSGGAKGGDREEENALFSRLQVAF